MLTLCCKFYKKEAKNVQNTLVSLPPPKEKELHYLFSQGNNGSSNFRICLINHILEFRKRITHFRFYAKSWAWSQCKFKQELCWDHIICYCLSLRAHISLDKLGSFHYWKLIMCTKTSNNNNNS